MYGRLFSSYYIYIYTVYMFTITTYLYLPQAQAKWRGLQLKQTCIDWRCCVASQSQSLPGEPKPLKSLADNFSFLWLGQEVQSDTCTLLMYIFVSHTYLLLGSVYNSMLLQQVFVCTKKHTSTTEAVQII